MSDLDKGLKKYEEFNQFEATKVKPLGIKSMPETATYQGKMKNTKYASRKWEHKTNYYTHDHDVGVKIYTPGGDVHVPLRIQRTNTLVKLGQLVSVEFEADGELREQRGRGAGLFCTPDGKCLVIIRGSKIEALIWGGRLAVEDRGIVG